MTTRRINVDLHSHTHFSRDGLTTPEQYVVHTLASGIDCAAVSDHNNIQGALEVRKLAPFQVIIAEEIKTTRGEIIGLFLNDEIPKGMSPEETVRAIKAQGALVLVPHPYDRLRPGSALAEDALLRIIDDVDIIEVFNSRTVLFSDNNRAARLARHYGKLRGAGSDSHSHQEIGRVKIDMPPFEGPGDFLPALAQGAIHAQPSSIFVHLRSTWAKLRWRLGFGVAR